jgi:hypothetical protein
MHALKIASTNKLGSRAIPAFTWFVRCPISRTTKAKDDQRKNEEYIPRLTQNSVFMREDDNGK